MIGATVPRKARSASVKRSHENCVSTSGGGDWNFRQRSTSPLEPASHSSSVSAKKMKEIGDASNKLKPSSSEIEIEIAELLYGLKTSKNHHTSSSKDIEKKKVEECNDNSSCALVPCNSATTELVGFQSEQPASVDCHDHEKGSTDASKDAFGEDKKSFGDGCSVVTYGKSVSPAKESLDRTELHAEKQGSTSTKVIHDVLQTGNIQTIGKFEIDLMASPPMMLSSEGDEISKGGFTSENEALALDLGVKREDINMIKDEDKVGRPVKKRKIVDGKPDVLKHNSEKPKSRLEQVMNKEQHTKSSNTIVEKTAQSSSVPLSTAGSGRPSSLSTIGNTPPLQTVVKMEKTTGSLMTPEPGKSVLSQPQLKRCATHHYIAHNIFLHQKLTKMNPLMLPASGSTSTSSSVSLCGMKSNNVNCVPSTESMVTGKQYQKKLPSVKQNATQEKKIDATSDPSLTAIKSSNNANPMDSTQRMQIVLQQGPQVHGPAFLFPLGHHQTSVATTTSQAGGNTTSASSYNKAHSSASRSLATSSTLPAAAASMSFSYPNFSTSETPYMTVAQNNGYSFPFSASIGSNVVIRGPSPAQATHILNGPYYSQTIHPLQHPQQQPQSKVLIQSSYLNESKSSSSSSHKQSQGAQVTDNSILTSPTMQSQQSQKQQNSLSLPHKHENDMGGDNASSVANRKSFPQNIVHGQNFTTPVHQVNFSFRPPTISDSVGGNSENFSDKQQEDLKGGAQTITSQPFAISLGAYGTNVPSNLNFSSMTQNPMIFQSLPDITWQGYQAAGTPHTTHQRTYSITEGKSGGNSSHRDDEKKTTHGKSLTNNGPTTLVFDNSSKNLNFVLSPTNGTWPSFSFASTAVTSVTSTVLTSAPLSSNVASSQESSQLLHLQKPHGMQLQQSSMCTRYKASSTNITPVTPNLKSFSQEQGRGSQGCMQISFGGDYITSLPPQPQGQQLLTNNRPVCTTVQGTPLNGGNVKQNTEGRKVISSMNTTKSHQNDNSSGSGKRSSPICGRNVQPILSPSQLSELKY